VFLETFAFLWIPYQNSSVRKSLFFIGRYSPPPPPPPSGPGSSSFTRFLDHTTMHNSWRDSSGRMISSSQRPLPHNTQHSQQRDIHAAGGIRNHNLSSRAAADLRLGPRDHWDRPQMSLHVYKNREPQRSLS